MKLIIAVSDDKAAEVREFLSAIERPVGMATKGIPGVQVRVNTGRNQPVDLSVRGVNITVEGMPTYEFEEGDVVRNTKSGNWGVITSINSKKGAAAVKASKETINETGVHKFISPLNELELLV